MFLKEFSAFSKNANHLLGDRSGRTISTRTANGFQQISPANVGEDNAVHIVHGAMVFALLFLCSKNKILRGIGAFLALTIILCYQLGKK